jgi:paraquat-inducible protein A
MGSAAVGGDLVECRDCGLLQRMHSIHEGDVAACSRCNATLRRAQNNFRALACVCAAAVLFCIALDSTMMTLSARGRVSTSSLLGAPEALGRFGFEAVGWLVVATLVVAPALKLGVLTLALCGERSPHPPPWLPWVFGWLERLNPWAMVEVFLLGVFVAYTRLKVIAAVEVGPALIALFGVMLASVAADAALDRTAVWEALDRHRLRPQRPSRAHGRLIGCLVCGNVARSPEGAPCRRCGHRLSHRKPNSLGRTWALLIAALLLYIPANALPIMSVTRFGSGGPHTILGGVRELFEDRLWPLAVIVLLASVCIPLAKLLSLGIMLVATHRRSSFQLLNRTRMFRVVAVIGRWSMIDIFALTVLVALVRMGFLARVLPENGAFAFAAVVILTMLATESFDPRLMWDAANRSHLRRLPAAVHTAAGNP